MRGTLDGVEKEIPIRNASRALHIRGRIVCTPITKSETKSTTAKQRRPYPNIRLPQETWDEIAVTMADFFDRMLRIR